MHKKPFSKLSTYLLVLVILACIGGCIVVQLWYEKQEKMLNGKMDNYYETQVNQK